MPLKDRVMTIRVSDAEYKIITDIAKELNVSKAEVWRRLLWTVRILYSDFLSAKDAFRNGVMLSSENASLRDILKPLPELLDMVMKKTEKNGEKKTKSR